MFTQNALAPEKLTKEQKEAEYFILYYQFVKHAFGLRYIEPAPNGVKLRLYFDQFPDTKEKSAKFKGYIKALETSPIFKKIDLKIDKQDIAEVRSHEHNLLQCLDIVLGAMAFRLNDLHKIKPINKHRRGKRTIAKEKLYKTIWNHLDSIRPRFNIGESTGIDGNSANRWLHPYRHWKFIPKNVSYDPEKTKNTT